MFAEVILPAIKEASEKGHSAKDIVIYVSEEQADKLKKNTATHDESGGDIGKIEGPAVQIDESRSGEWELKK